MVFDCLAASLPLEPSTVGIFEKSKAIGEAIEVARSFNQDAATVLQEFWNFTDRGRDARYLSGQTVQKENRKALIVRGQKADIESVVQVCCFGLKWKSVKICRGGTLDFGVNTFLFRPAAD